MFIYLPPSDRIIYLFYLLGMKDKSIIKSEKEHSYKVDSRDNINNTLFFIFFGGEGGVLETKPSTHYM